MFSKDVRARLLDVTGSSPRTIEGAKKALVRTLGNQPTDNLKEISSSLRNSPSMKTNQWFKFVSDEVDIILSNRA